jgi:hypothetical protein
VTCLLKLLKTIACVDLSSLLRFLGTLCWSQLDFCFTMKISTLTAALLIGSVSAFFQEHDLLAAKGLEKLAVHVARNGYPNPEKCTLKNVSVRREW